VLFDGYRALCAALPAHEGLPSVATLDAAWLAPVRARGRTDLALEVQPPSRPRGPRRLDELYDVRISSARRIPTREGSWHDAMNALVAATYPRTKATLHARHRGELEAHFRAHGGLPNARSRLQDVLALFDEGGLVIVTREATVSRLEALVRGGDARDLVHAIAETESRALVFGHAVLEHAVLGAPLPRAFGVVVPDPSPHDDEAILTPRLDLALATVAGELATTSAAPGLRLGELFALE
jgi:hypothetical protein